jgi:head-tail adaptor
MSAATLLSPRYTRMLRKQLFTRLCDVEVKTVVADAYGSETETWAQVETLRHIPCAIAPVTTVSGERQQQFYTPTENAWFVLMSGGYPEITTRHRVTIDGVAYDIDAVEVYENALTRLRVSQVGV